MLSLWKAGNGKYKRSFSTSDTWHIIREKYAEVDWYKVVWFKHSTPKFSFIVWLAVRDRLSTGSRMRSWNGNVDASCMFCQEPLETVEHLFFDCSYSRRIWEVLVKGVLGVHFTVNWQELLQFMVSSGHNKLQIYATRYAFQGAVHGIWRERNRRRHGETACPPALLIKMIDRTVRNKLSIMKKKRDMMWEEGLRFWFATRQS